VGKTWVEKTTFKPFVPIGFISFFFGFGTRHIRGVVVRKQNQLPCPPYFPNSKFFSKILQRYHSAKLQAILKTKKSLGKFYSPKDSKKAHSKL
jgi:hypothetical protein